MYACVRVCVQDVDEVYVLERPIRVGIGFNDRQERRGGKEGGSFSSSSLNFLVLYCTVFYKLLYVVVF